MGNPADNWIGQDVNGMYKGFPGGQWQRTRLPMQDAWEDPLEEGTATHSNILFFFNIN